MARDNTSGGMAAATGRGITRMTTCRGQADEYAITNAEISGFGSLI